MNKIHIMKRFLRKLINSDNRGGNHTELINLRKCIPTHLRGSSETNEAIKELVDSGFLKPKRSTGEIHVSLNPKKQQEIYEFIKE